MECLALVESRMSFQEPEKEYVLFLPEDKKLEKMGERRRGGAIAASLASVGYCLAQVRHGKADGEEMIK